MKKFLYRVMIVMLIISFLVVLCSCRMEESYKEFNIKNISNNLNDNYFESDDFDFAKFENVVFIPEIKEIHHGEYIIYISAYSESGTEQIKVKSVILKEKEDVLLEYKLNKNILLEENKDSIFEGWIDGGRFTESTVEIEDDKAYELIVQAEIANNTAIMSGSIVYEVVVKGYKSFLAPT